MSWVVWLTGLSGSGKSTVALAVKKKIPEAVILKSDDLRKVITPDPAYTDSERDYVYRALIYVAKTISELQHEVIIDATGNRRYWRELARKLIPEFYEIYVRCPINICIQREKQRRVAHGAPKDIYEKAESGAPIPGVNVPYEEPECPELTINTDREMPEEAAERIVKMVETSEKSQG